MCERGKVELGETIIIVESLGGDNTTEDIRMSKEMISTEMIKLQFNEEGGDRNHQVCAIITKEEEIGKLTQKKGKIKTVILEECADLAQMTATEVKTSKGTIVHIGNIDSLIILVQTLLQGSIIGIEEIPKRDVVLLFQCITKLDLMSHKGLLLYV